MLGQQQRAVDDQWMQVDSSGVVGDGDGGGGGAGAGVRPGCRAQSFRCGSWKCEFYGKSRLVPRSEHKRGEAAELVYLQMDKSRVEYQILETLTDEGAREEYLVQNADVVEPIGDEDEAEGEQEASAFCQ